MRYEVICLISQCFIFSTCVSFLLLFSHPSSAPFLWGWHGLCMRTWRTSQRSTSPMRLNPLDISAREHPSHHSGLENPCTGLMVEKNYPKQWMQFSCFIFVSQSDDGVKFHLADCGTTASSMTQSASTGSDHLSGQSWSLWCHTKSCNSMQMICSSSLHHSWCFG